MEKKMKLKEELLKKIKEDEEEREMLENKIAKIERDEMKVLTKFKGDKEELFSHSFDYKPDLLTKQNVNILHSPNKTVNFS